MPGITSLEVPSMTLRRRFTGWDRLSNPGVSEFSLHSPGSPLADQLSDLAQQLRQIFGLDQHRLVSLARIGSPWRILIGRNQCRRRLVVHHPSVSENLQSGLGRFHVQIAEHKLEFRSFQLAYRLCG